MGGVILLNIVVLEKGKYMDYLDDLKIKATVGIIFDVDVRGRKNVPRQFHFGKICTTNALG